jgi:hypothetical protein
VCVLLAVAKLARTERHGGAVEPSETPTLDCPKFL